MFISKEYISIGVRPFKKTMRVYVQNRQYHIIGVRPFKKTMRVYVQNRQYHIIVKVRDS